MKTNYQSIAEALVEKALKSGATQAQVSISDGVRFSANVREGEVEQLISAGSTSLSLKVIVNNRVSSASTSDLTTATLDKLLASSIATARFLSADEYAVLPELEKMNFSIESLQLYDSTAESIDPAQKIKLATEVEKICLADKRVKSSSGSSFGNFSGTTYLAMSNGFSANYRRSSSSFGVYLQAGSDDNPYADGYYDSARGFNDLLSPEEVAQKAIYRVTRLIDAKKVKTQNVPIILEPSMTSRVLLSFLNECLSGNNVYMKRSFLAGKLNEKIASDNFNLFDDALIPGGRGTTPFDGDGVPGRKLNIIENGVLKNYYLSNYTARKLNMKPTGPSPTNLTLANGKYSQEEIIKSVDNGLLLCSTIGQGTVPTTGDISKGAYGIWIEKGELTYPVSEVTFSGNLGKILQEIEMIGNDPEPRSSVSAPTVKIKEMTISGL